MSSAVLPFQAIIYSATNRENISNLALPDLDSAQNLWGDIDSSFSFRNVLMGPVQQRGELWQSWQANKVTEFCEDLAYYIVNHKTELLGKKIDRWSLVASVDCADSNILIHEDVFSDGVERARQSMESCEGDLAPIFIGVGDSIGKNLRSLLQQLSTSCELILQYRESTLSLHQVWACKNKQAMEKIRNLFTDEKLYLLDGHHRLAAAKENTKKGLGDGKLMANICSLEAIDTAIFPIHRSVYYERWMLPDRWINDLAGMGCKWKEIRDWKPQDLEKFFHKNKKGVVNFLALHAHSNVLMDVEMPLQLALPVPLQNLCVANFELLFTKKIPKATIFPVPEERVVFEQLAIDQAQVGIFLPPVLPEEVRVVALAGIKLPKKSTRFMPKPALGLVCRPWT